MSFDSSFARFIAEVLPPDMPEQMLGQLRQCARPLHIGRKHSPNLTETVDHLVFIAEGATKLVAMGGTGGSSGGSSTDSDGGEQILSFKFAGDCVSVPHASMHSYWLVAMRDTEALVFNADKLQTLAAHNSGLSQALSQCAANALQQTRMHLLAMGRRSATERVASFLMTMREVRQVSADGGQTLNLIMTRREIADCLGLTIETVSRQFSKLRDLRLIETPSRTVVTLNDPEKLAICAGNSPGAG